MNRRGGFRAAQIVGLIRGGEIVLAFGHDGLVQSIRVVNTQPVEGRVDLRAPSKQSTRPARPWKSADHREQTKGHVERLKKAFEPLEAFRLIWR